MVFIWDDVSPYVIRNRKDGLLPPPHCVFFGAKCLKEDSEWSLNEMSVKFCKEVFFVSCFYKCKFIVFEVTIKRLCLMECKKVNYL